MDRLTFTTRQTAHRLPRVATITALALVLPLTLTAAQSPPDRLTEAPGTGGHGDQADGWWVCDLGHLNAP